MKYNYVYSIDTFNKSAQHHWKEHNVYFSLGGEDHLSLILNVADEKYNMGKMSPGWEPTAGDLIDIARVKLKELGVKDRELTVKLMENDKSVSNVKKNTQEHGAQHIITEDHFNLFKLECKNWIEYWGLKDWLVYYDHSLVKDGFASCTAHLTGKAATLRLTTEVAPDMPELKNIEGHIKRAAFHEVCELLIVRLRTLAEYRHSTADEIMEANHDIIRRLENTVFKQHEKGIKDYERH